MCLEYKYTDERKKAWLKDKPKMITAYKVVQIQQEDKVMKLFPIMYGDDTHFKRTNTLSKVKSTTLEKREFTHHGTAAGEDSHYMAYFHLFVKKEDAIDWMIAGINQRVIKCTIPKKFITDVGYQNDKFAIVTRGFDIIGQDEYLI